MDGFNSLRNYGGMMNYFRRDDNNIEAQKFKLYITKDYMNNDLIRLLGYIYIPLW